MNHDWKNFLTDAGAEFGEQGVESFGNPERERRVTTAGDVLCDLSHDGLIAVYGEDATAFLQGQLSNDVSQLDAGRSQLNSYCTPKGRMLANFRLFKRSDTYYLRLPQSLVEPTLKRLRMFVMRSKVTLENADEALTRIGWSGPNAESELRDALGGANVPDTPDAMLTLPELNILRVPGIHPRFEIYGQLEAVQRLWDKLNVRGAPVGAANWGLLNVLAGIPTIYPATSEAFVPQMANMELIGGVSFNKGCYPGQEIVARMQYLGTLKRRMYRFHADLDACAPGQEIVDTSMTEPGRVGIVVEAYRHPNGGVEGLAVLQIQSVAESAGKLRLDTAKGARITVSDPPYPLTVAD
ncbi:YgfZ/GcvT domain-containing protein [Acidihalobacter ferrooxydans]|uniref:Glycine cleavage system protein T n=1 Tax=Acidihalobacter ferrooxydans TaxID=1765967 RepID=A0A1P8UFX8_9GAMM|nr:folate-binding protein YgfZ [Acidihalobacter ferrooxydans]APZ42674.1 glycine cleavage system protein T [Acidihalobacter ferrooxydans]